MYPSIHPSIYLSSITSICLPHLSPYLPVHLSIAFPKTGSCIEEYYQQGSEPFLGVQVCTLPGHAASGHPNCVECLDGFKDHLYGNLVEACLFLLRYGCRIDRRRLFRREHLLDPLRLWGLAAMRYLAQGLEVLEDGLHVASILDGAA